MKPAFDCIYQRGAQLHTHIDMYTPIMIRVTNANVSFCMSIDTLIFFFSFSPDYRLD